VLAAFVATKGNGCHDGSGREKMMDTSHWLSALGLLLTYPVLIVVMFLVACASFGFAWWLCSNYSRGRIEGLEERLRLAREQFDTINSQLTDVRTRVTTQETEIANLRRALPPPARVEQLARSNSEIQDALTSLATSTSHLGHTLTLASGQYRVMVEPIVKRST
jgi:hypothetical protein